jgi:uncharacterized surface protein with fasciclin (FAS1) repeats
MLKNIFFKFVVIALFLVSVFTSCQDANWAEHYELSQINSNKTLLEEMESDTSLTHFVQILKSTGYDKVLSASQSYTVWAPTNAALSTISIQDTVAQFLKNHVARFSYSTADLATNPSIRVKMLNGKANLFTKTGSTFSFGSANVVGKDIVTENGVLHKIDNYIPFFKNVWENVSAISGNDSISKYLHSFDKKMFDAANSVEINTSSAGIVYDSVFIYSNAWLSKFGRINVEDSVYTMILPNNAGWNSAYASIKPYFKTYDKLSSETSTTKTFKLTGTLADSLQRAYTMQALTHDLVFRTKLNAIPGDSLVSTNGNVFHTPAHLFNDAVAQESSNGLVYSSSALSYLPSESYQKRIVVEAEKTTGRVFNNASIYTRTAKNEALLPLISGRQYAELSPTGTNPNFQPELILDIPNTLAATYDIYCVCVPAFATDTARNATSTDSTKVSFQLTYVDATGLMSTKTAITKDPVTAKVFETSPTKVTKFLIAKGFKFPFANFTGSPFTGAVSQVNTVSIKVKTNVLSTEYTAAKYTRNLRVDCFILEPAN